MITQMKHLVGQFGHWLAYVKSVEEYAINYEIYDGYDLDDITAGPEMEGFVRWDGCSNWRTVETNYIHFCEPTDMNQLNEALVACYNYTAEHLKTWNE